ncbi:MAG: hypothetical protein ACO3BO_09125 [Anaerohalosphaeraceae bacterium]
MKKLFCVLALLVICNFANAVLTPNPDSFERSPGEIILGDNWEWYTSGSGASGWCMSTPFSPALCGWANITDIDATDGTNCLEAGTTGTDVFGYFLVSNHGTPVVEGAEYTFSVDYKKMSSVNLVFRLEFFDDPARTTLVDDLVWDPYAGAAVGVWDHFSTVFTVPAGANYLSIVMGATGPNGVVRYDMVSLIPTVCPYAIVGDVDNNCRVDLVDVSLLAANWLIDCIDDPANPACVTP